MAIEEIFKSPMKNYEYLEKKNDYLWKKLGNSLKNKRRNLYHYLSFDASQDDEDRYEHPFGDLRGEESKPRFK